MNLLKILFISSLFSFSCRHVDHKKIESAIDYKRIESEAMSAYERNDYRNAVILFSELLKADSTKGEFYFKRGYSYSMLLNVEDAIKDYKKAIACGHRVADAYNNIGINYSTIDDSLAIVYFKKAIEAGYDNNKIYERIEECKKRLNDANKQFDK